jgi:putative DNA primase/helicase
MDLEKKSQQSYQGDLRVRFLAFGNGTLQALHDRSVGFFRRQIILSVKERDPDRKDDPYLAEKLCSEAEGIFLWALEGLQRLIRNEYKFTLSTQAEENMAEAVAEGNNLVEFMKSEGYFRFKADGQITSKELYALYELWCDENSGKAVSPKSFGNYMCQNEKQLNLERSNNVRNRDGRRVWGFWGMEPVVKLYV